MSEGSSEQGWFHCEHCGALYRAAVAAGQRGACPECGSIGGQPPVEELGAGVAAEEQPQMIRKKKRRRGQPRVEEFEGGGSRKRKRGSRKKAKWVAIAAASWVVILVGTVIYLRIYHPDTPEATFAQAPPQHEISVEDNALLQEKGPEIISGFKAFLADTNPSSRASHVLKATSTLGRMTRLEGANPDLAYLGSLMVGDRNVIMTPAGKALELVWKLDTTQQVETVLFEENGQWKIDWDDYVRYSPDNWPLFLAGGGPDEGEFRLLARQRAATNSLAADKMALVLSLPKYGSPGETLNSSPTIIVDRTSEMGARLEAAFDLRAKGVGEFNSLLPKYDPPDQIRVRVKVSRKGDEQKTFRIEQLISCHWLELEDAGKAKDAAASKP